MCTGFWKLVMFPPPNMHHTLQRSQAPECLKDSQSEANTLSLTQTCIG